MRRRTITLLATGAAATMRRPSVRLAVAALSACAVGAAAGPADAAFPGANGRIVYESGTEHGRLYDIRPSGSGRRPIAGSPSGLFRDPAYSADGRRIVAVVGGDDLAVLTSSGRLVRRLGLTRTVGQANRAHHPAWSPGGRWIVFDVCEEFVFTDIEDCVRRGVYRVRANGTGLRRLVEGESASWSPDGRLISFLRGCELRVMRPDGSGQRTVVRRRGRACQLVVLGGAPDFSPDGSRLALAYVPSPGQRRTAIYTVGVNGRGLRRVTRTPRDTQDMGPAWSPDGRRIAFFRLARRARGDGIFVVPASGGSARRVGEAAESLDWQPRSRRPPRLTG